MPTTFCAPPGPFMRRHRRAGHLLLLLVPLSVAPPAHSADSVSCLVLPSEPPLEWTLVAHPAESAPGSVDAPDGDTPGATLLLAFDGHPADAIGPGAPELAAFEAAAARGPNIFLKAWLPITIGELSLLTITAMLPKDWTGWSADFVSDGAGNFAEAWTRPPVMDTDHWFHNYIGHPYGGSFYYNSVRTREASPMQSMAFAAALSFQWEYVFEAVAERPSIQDLVITPIAGAALGELTHRMSRSMRKGRVTLPEKVAMTLLNPADVLAHGYKSSD